MKNPFKKSGDTASIEAELKRLADRKADAERRRSEVLHALDEARQARRDVLDADDAAIAAASGKLKALQVEATDLAELVTDLEAAIEAASERFRRARENEARQTAAAQLEAIAAKVDGQTTELEKAAKALAKAARGMLNAIPDAVGTFRIYHGDRPEHRQERGDYASGREAVAAALADALAAELPELFDRYRENGYRRALLCVMDPQATQPSYRANVPTEPLPAREVVNALIVDRLKTRAQAIRAGEEDADVAGVELRVAVPRPPKTVEVMAIEHVNMITPNGIFSPIRRIMTKGQTDSFAPDHVAKLLKTGVFVRADSAEADKIRADIENRDPKRIFGSSGNAGIGFDETRDLGDPLGLLEAEKEEAARID
ncbi:MAG TPA: hypothetical protein DIC56_06465 [Rhizobium sp.]|nr:hypothetical protein [Rhizobium sp.]